MKRAYLFLCLGLISLYLVAQRKTIYVDQSQSGQSIQEAFNQIPKLRKQYTVIEILIAEGIYYLDKPLTINHEKGGDDDTIVYVKGLGSVIISGGRTIVFQPTSRDNIYSAVFESPQSPSDLYIAGERKKLARTPNQGFFNLKSVREELINTRKPGSEQQSFLYLKFDDSITDNLKTLSEKELSNVRIQFIHKWDQTIRILDSYHRETGEFTTRPARKMKSHNPIKTGTRYFIQGYKNAIDEKGEWLETDGQYELLFENEVDAVVPVMTRLFTIIGTAQKKVRKVVFNNIIFRHSNDLLAEHGWDPHQSGASLNAAFWVRNADSILIKNCSFEKMGLFAVWFEKGVTNSEITNSFFKDLGAGAIKIGSKKRGTEPIADVSQYNRIENNIIQTGGLSYPCAAGVWIGNSGHNRIVHNDISDFRYTGISIGWKLGYGATNALHNEIVYNRIHHLGWSMMSDMAGIYTLGESTKTVIRRNVIHDIAGYSQSYGLYEDEGSSGLTFTENLVFRTLDAGFIHHYGSNNLIKNNAFGLGLDSQLFSARVEAHLSFSFIDNLVYFNSGKLFRGNWKRLKSNFKGNRIFHDTEAINLGAYIPLSARRFNTSEVEKHEMEKLADFVAWSTHKFANFGWEIPDWESAGVYGSDDWVNRARLSSQSIKEFETRHIELRKNRSKMYSVSF